MTVFLINSCRYVHEDYVVKKGDFTLKGRGNIARRIARQYNAECYYFCKNKKDEWFNTSQKSVKAQLFFSIEWCKKQGIEDEGKKHCLEWDIKKKDIDSTTEKMVDWQAPIEVNGRKYMLCSYLNIKAIFNLGNGYINAVNLCKQYGERKSYRKWKVTNSYKDIVKEFEIIQKEKKTVTEFSHSLEWEYEENSMVNKGIIKGTYIHPKLAAQLAQWISPIFAIKVSEMIDTFTRKQREEEMLNKILEKETVFQFELEKKDVLIDTIKANHAEAMRIADEERIRTEANHAEAMRKADENKKELYEQMHKLEVELANIKQYAKDIGVCLEEQYITTLLVDSKLDKIAKRVVNPPSNKKNIERLYLFRKITDNEDFVFRITKRQDVSGNGKKDGEKFLFVFEVPNARQIAHCFSQAEYEWIEAVSFTDAENELYVFKCNSPQGVDPKNYIKMMIERTIQEESKKAIKGKPENLDRRVKI